MHSSQVNRTCDQIEHPENHVGLFFMATMMSMMRTDVISLKERKKESAPKPVSCKSMKRIPLSKDFSTIVFLQREQYAQCNPNDVLRTSNRLERI